MQLTHNIKSADFTAPRSKEREVCRKNKLTLLNARQMIHLTLSSSKITEDPSHMWTSIELHQIYRNENSQQSRKSILEKLKLHFGKN